MKTSRAQQDETRRRILVAATELFPRQGYESTTMKDVARAAGIGDATIYKYFASKERLVLGYFDLAVAEALIAYQATPGLASYTLHESLQRLTDAMLERLCADREFVLLSRELLRRAPVLILSEQLALKQTLRLTVMSLLQHAEDTSEIEPCEFKSLLSGSYVDYLLCVLSYWLNDESEGFAQTTELVDLSLGLGVLVLRSGLINKALALGAFMLRSQMARYFAPGAGVLDGLKVARQAFGEVKVGGARVGNARAGETKLGDSKLLKKPAKPAPRRTVKRESAS